MSFRLGSLVIILLGLVFFARLIVQPDGLLYSDYSDFLAYHVPCKHFLVRSWQQDGELPLWCAEMFSGMPFIQDPQVSAFYPPHLPLYFFPESWVGAALSWIVVAHVIAAGLCMYAYAGHRGLKPMAALVSGVGYMFAGKWLVHLLVAGHIYVAPLAWLPLVLLLLEQALEKKRLLRATAAGAAFALIVLGTHPQVTIYSGFFVALWTLPRALGETAAAKRRRSLVRWLGFGVWTAVVAGLLCAIQVLPALEASSQSSRTLGLPLSPETFVRGVRTAIGLVGAPLTTDHTWLWEDRGAIGLLWLALAVCAPLLVPDKQLRLEAKIALAWVILSIGGAAVFQFLPGFHLWRLYSRMLLVAALPIALFAGKTTQALLDEGATSDELRTRCHTILLKTTVWILVPLGCYALLQAMGGRSMQFPTYWLTLPLTIAGMCWILRRAKPLTGPAWLALLVIDLWAIGLPWVSVRPESEIFAPSACVRYLSERADQHGRVMDVNPIDPGGNAIAATPLWLNEAMVAGIEPVRGYNPLDVLRYKEYLQFLMNEDHPLSAVGPFTKPYPRWPAIENQSLADLLGLRYLLVPSEMPLEQVVSSKEGRASWNKVFEDPAPWGYAFVPTDAEGLDAGMVRLPPYTVYENRHSLPRAFIVPFAEPLAERAHALEQLRSTDFRTRVLLEGFEPKQATASRNQTEALHTASPPAEILRYSPNQVLIQVHLAAPSYLLLTDPWYPGWTCTVDGNPSPVYRANFLFRAIEVPAGSHQVMFTLAPRSFQIGKLISEATLVLLTLAFVTFACWRAAKSLLTRNPETCRENMALSDP